MDIYVLPLFVIVCLHNKGENYHFCISINNHIIVIGGLQGRIQNIKLGGAHIKKLRRAEGGAIIFGIFRVKNHDFTPKNHIFSNFSGGGGASRVHPLYPPLVYTI
jgi:hypothetical protein